MKRQKEEGRRKNNLYQISKIKDQNDNAKIKYGRAIWGETQKLRPDDAQVWIPAFAGMT
jgi:hypothetical protein